MVSTNPLPAWNDGPTRRAIIDFVARTTRGPDRIPVEQRIAVFDNDGTLWAEQPVYVEAAFVLDRVVSLAHVHPEWRREQPFRGVLERDPAAVAATGMRGIVQLVAATHTGNTGEEFDAIVRAWIGSATDARFHRRYTELVYAPMLDLLSYLRAHDYKTYLVSGGGVEFIRPWSERVYGIPPEQVIGSRAKTRYEIRGDMPVLARLPEIDFIDDKAGKPVAIQQAIGRRPVIAVGNSDGDFEMLEWTTSAPGPRLGVIVHHTDAKREWAYDRDGHAGKLVRALAEAPQRGWVVADMQRDWNVVFPFERR